MMARIGEWLRRIWLVLVVGGAVIILDQWTKQLVRAAIPDYTGIVPIDTLGEYFVFEHVHNYGAAFGILQNQGNFFVIIAAVVAVTILVYVRYLPADQWLVRVFLGLMLGGAIGNVIDRIQLGYVTDFVKIGIPGVYYWPNFNIADSAIVVGVIGLGLYLLIDDLRKSRREKAGVSSELGELPSGSSGSQQPE